MCLAVVLVVVLIFDAISLLPAVTPVDHRILSPLNGNTQQRGGDHRGGIPPTACGGTANVGGSSGRGGGGGGSSSGHGHSNGGRGRGRGSSGNSKWRTIATNVPIFQSGITCEGIHSEERKGRKFYFYLRQQLLRKTNLDPIFSESRFGTLANKNKKELRQAPIYGTTFKKNESGSDFQRIQIWNNRSQKQKKNYGRHPL
jgi:hypothetical protein